MKINILLVLPDAAQLKLITDFWFSWAQERYELFVLKDSRADFSDAYLHLTADKYVRLYDSFIFKSVGPLWVDEFQYVFINGPMPKSRVTGMEFLPYSEFESQFNHSRK